MALSTTQKTSEGKTWVHITGDAEEVLQELADAGVTAGNVVSVADDATSATYCKQY